VEGACVSTYTLAGPRTHTQRVQFPKGKTNIVLSSEFSQVNSLVLIGVGSQKAPWRCLVSNSGVVAEVSFAGSEGAL
jgi:hypothetical protein